MGTVDQTAVIESLGASSTHGGMTVERIDTHSPIVFLAGARAWKVKCAVRRSRSARVSRVTRLHAAGRRVARQAAAARLCAPVPW